MAPKPHEHDISIGQDRWILSGDLAGGQSRAIQIDSQLAPVMSLLESLETECVAECCGIDAFGFWPDQIENAVRSLSKPDRDALASTLSAIDDEIRQLPSDTVVSTRINQYFRKEVFLELLKHIRTVIEGIPPASPIAKA